MSAREKYDAAILGATPAGILCAVRAARQGLTVALISHEEHLGGMLSSNLGVFDTLEGHNLKRLLEPFLPKMVVLSPGEIPPAVPVQTLATLS